MMTHELDYTYPVMGLVEEAGEVSGKFAKAVRDDSGHISDDRKQAIKKELGDVCWFIAELSTLMGFELEDVMKSNIDKLTSRKNRNVISGSGDDR
jgi:NTP pyrophosphatase (non-canonical NTP hydrolase)